MAIFGSALTSLRFGEIDIFERVIEKIFEIFDFHVGVLLGVSFCAYQATPTGSCGSQVTEVHR